LSCGAYNPTSCGHAARLASGQRVWVAFRRPTSLPHDKRLTVSTFHHFFINVNRITPTLYAAAYGRVDQSLCTTRWLYHAVQNQLLLRSRRPGFSVCHACWHGIACFGSNCHRHSPLASPVQNWMRAIVLRRFAWSSVRRPPRREHAGNILARQAAHGPLRDSAICRLGPRSSRRRDPCRA